MGVDLSTSCKNDPTFIPTFVPQKSCALYFRKSALKKQSTARPNEEPVERLVGRSVGWPDLRSRRNKVCRLKSKIV